MKKETQTQERGRFVFEAMAALTNLHALGNMLHRDLKAESIMIQEKQMPDGSAARSIRLADFGSGTTYWIFQRFFASESERRGSLPDVTEAADGCGSRENYLKVVLEQGAIDYNTQ